MEEVTRGSYWSTMPADVRYNKELSMAAKVIYSEIASLCNSSGYCWAKNEYFAQLFGVSISSVSRWISQLEKLGFIRSEMAPTEKGSERRIYAGLMVDRQDPPEPESREPETSEDPAPEDQDPGGLSENDQGGLRKFAQGGLRKNAKGGLRKFAQQNNNIINNKLGIEEKESKKKKKPGGGELDDETKELLRQYVGEDRALHAALGDMIASRRELGAVNSKRAMVALLHQLDEHSGGSRAGKLLLLRRAVSSGWKTVYPLKDWELEQVRRQDTEEEPPEGTGGFVGDPEVLRAEDSPYLKFKRQWEAEHGDG